MAVMTVSLAGVRGISQVQRRQLVVENDISVKEYEAELTEKIQ